MAKDKPIRGIGNILFPWRFIGFIGVAAAGAAISLPAVGWRMGAMLSFDIAALAFLLSCIPLFRDKAEGMREATKRNDGNRALLLVISSGVIAVIMVAVGSELMQAGSPEPRDVALIIATLALAWLFSNLVYTLHYAHIFYKSDAAGDDTAGLSFPGTDEPDYWDFVYFSFCLGMTFQTSDVEMQTGLFRRVSTLHCLAAFMFNIGVIAFTINVLGG